jgi:hypothetical protein
MRNLALDVPRSGRPLGRARTRDGFMTFDSTNATRTHDAAGNHMGVRFDRPYRVHDGRTVDSTGAFLVGELERLDQELHMPLAEISYLRDIELREDVTIADDVTSFTLSTYASSGGLGTGASIGNGKSWIGRNTTQIANINLDIGKIPHPLRPWGEEVKWTIFELESAARAGRPIDDQKHEGLKLKHQMDTDEQVYIGDTGTGDLGLVNASSAVGGQAAVTVTNLPNGALGSPNWANKTPVEILADFNAGLTLVWAASAWAVIPQEVRIPPAQFGMLSTELVSQAGNVSILKYIEDNNILTAAGRGKLNIQPLKWLIGSGAGGTVGTTGTVDRMLIYTNEKRRVRFPMTMLQRTPIQYDGIYQKCTYFGRLGVVEWVYPETAGYFDGL